MNSLPIPRWSIAVFAARESVPTLVGCVKAAVRACGATPSIIDVLINGNKALADLAAPPIKALNLVPASCLVRVWFIELGDKAHVWNEYMYRIHPACTLSFFIDGYVEVAANAFDLIDSSLAENADAIAATGVPSEGRSATAQAAQLIRWGGLHGNLYALRQVAMQTIVARGFRMPLGLYRNDSLLASILSFNIDPTTFEWRASRILVHPKATWTVLERKLPLLQKLKVHAKRQLRQAQGELEKQAAREHLANRRQPPETLATTSAAMVADWISNHPDNARKVFLRQPLTLYALRKLRRPEDWRTVGIEPVLL